MTKFFTRLVFLILIVSLLGCFRIAYKLEEGSAEVSRTEYWNNYFLFGLVPVNERYELGALCPDRRPMQVRTLMKPANVLSTILGADLTTASTIEVMCSKDVSKPAPNNTFSDFRSRFKLPF